MIEHKAFVKKYTKPFFASLPAIMCVMFCFGGVHFTHFTIEDGLSQSSIKCIYQDYQGFLWFGTADGLNKFDGYSFTTYRNDPNLPNSISGNDISVIYESPYDSVLWIGTQDGGLNRFDRAHNQFYSYKADTNSQHSIPSNNIRDIVASQDGKIWIASYYGGIFCFQPEDSMFYQPGFAKKPRFKNIQCIKEGPAGNLWIGASSGLYKWGTEGRLKNKAPVKILLDKNKRTHNITSLMADYHGNIWTGTLSRGLFIYHPVSEELTHYKTSKNEGALNSNNIQAIIQTKKGKVWVGTSDGIALYNNSGFFEKIKNLPEDPNSLNNNLIYSIFEDSSGIIWVGTYLGGVSKYDPLQARFPRYRNLISKYNERNNDIRSVAFDNNNVLWVGTSVGLIKIDDENLHKNKPQGVLLLEGERVNNLVYSSMAGIFISSSNGIFLHDLSGNLIPLNEVIYRQTGYKIQFFISGEAQGGKVWLGTSRGLLEYSCDTKKFELFITPNGFNKNSNISPLTLLEDYSGKIWIGTYFGQLYIFDKYTKKFHHYPIDSKQISYTRIFSLCEPKPGEIWIGTNRGLYQLMTNTRTIKRFLTSDGLPNDVIYSVIPDQENNIWCSTNNGISCYNSKTGDFSNYTHKDGLQSNEFNQGAYFQDGSGTIYMGGINGLNIFHPDKIITNTFIPPVIITSMEIEYQKISPRTHPGLLSTQISETSEVKLNYKKNTFSFEYTALSNSLPERNEYQYCLTKEGEEDKWIYAGKRRFASFTNIDPGIYYFKVKGSNSDGVWNEQPASLRIDISPPFWQKWWFRISALILIALIVSLIFNIRTRSIRSQKKLLEQRVNKKTRQINHHKEQIEKQNDDLLVLNEHMKHKNKLLNSQNKKISLQRDNLINMADQLKKNNQSKIQFYTALSHELKTPLTLILEPIKEILEEGKKISIKEIQNKLKVVRKNASKLLVTTNQILDLRKIESNSIKLNVSKFDLVTFIQETAYHFKEHAKKGEYRFTVKSAASNIKIWADKDKLEKVFFNLLSNAFKYTGKEGVVAINIQPAKEGDKTVFISVEDSGQGIPEEKLPLIFDHPFHPENTTIVDFPSSGLGLAITKRYIELHKGSIKVKSDIGKGSIFTVKLPLGKNHFDEGVVFVTDRAETNDLLFFSIDDYQPTVKNTISSRSDLEKPLLLLYVPDKDLQNYLSEYLARYFRIEITSGLDSILKISKEKHPDVIVADMLLKKNDVLDYCSQIKDDFTTSHIPIVVLSLYGDTNTRKKALRAGVDKYLEKPLDLQHLLLTIENLIENRKKLRVKFDQNNNLPVQKGAINPNDQGFLDTAIKYIEENIQNVDFNVETLCGLLNLSQPQVYRKIKALTKSNITEFIRNVKLKKAAQLLRAGNNKVNEVAYQTGFNNPNYFTKSFSKLYGMTPTEYSNSFR